MPSIRNFDERQMRTRSARLNVIAIAVLLLCVAASAALAAMRDNPFWLIGGVLIGVIAAQAPKVASQWERAVVLRLGKFVGLRGPGLFWIMPLVDSVSTWIDQR